MKSYTLKAVIQATQWTGDNLNEMQEFIPIHSRSDNPIGVRTISGIVRLNEGDFVVKDRDFGFMVYEEKVFHEMFQLIEE